MEGKTVQVGKKSKYHLLIALVFRNSEGGRACT